MKKQHILTVAAALAAASAWAKFDCRVTVWRGERLNVRLPDAAHEFDLSGAPKGLEVQFGKIRPVPYRETMGLEYRSICDRAVYGAEGGLGPSFATITAAPDLAPGAYDLGSLKVTVLDRTLPPAKTWKYYLDLWQHPWAVARVAGAKPFSAAHYAAMRPLWERLAAAGQKTLTVTLSDSPWNQQCYDKYGSMIGRRRDADGTWHFDYAVFDEYVAFGRSCGLGPYIACYSMCPWGYVVDYVDAEGKTVRRPACPGEPFFDEYWGDFLTDFGRHLREKGWFADTVLAMDERSPKDVAYVTKFVKSRLPGMKISMAGNMTADKFKDIDIDIYSQSAGHISPAFSAISAERRRKGRITTHYVCCGPERPNTFMRSAPGQAYWCAFYPIAVGLDGFLRWAYNSWGGNTGEISYDRWSAGDVAFVYPDGSPSRRFLELENGIQAAEKFRILAADPARAAEMKALAAEYDFKKAANPSFDCQRLMEKTQRLLNR